MSDEQTETVMPGNGPGDEYVSKTGIWILVAVFCLIAIVLLGFLVGCWPDSELASAQTTVAAVKSSSSGKRPPTDTGAAQTTDATTSDDTAPDSTTSDTMTTGDAAAGNSAAEEKAAQPASDTSKEPEAAFEITSILPDSSDPKGGAFALISGSEFPKAVTVKFGEIPATEAAIINKELIRAKIPEHAVGAVDVTVEGDGKTAELAQGFVYRDSLTQSDVLVLVLLAGALGGCLYSLISLAWYIGNRELKWSWVPSYLVRPLTAAALASIFFLTLVTGVWTDQTGRDQLWIVGFAALVGLFSKQGYEKLKAIFEAVLTPAPKGADTPKKIPASGIALDKSSGKAAGGEIIQITGSGFTMATTVKFDSVDATSIRLDSPSVLHVVVPPHAPGQVNVTVTNPGNPPEIRTAQYSYT